MQGNRGFQTHSSTVKTEWHIRLTRSMRINSCSPIPKTRHSRLYRCEWFGTDQIPALPKCNRDRMTCTKLWAKRRGKEVGCTDDSSGDVDVFSHWLQLIKTGCTKRQHPHSQIQTRRAKKLWQCKRRLKIISRIAYHSTINPITPWTSLVRLTCTDHKRVRTNITVGLKLSEQVELALGSGVLWSVKHTFRALKKVQS